MSYFLGFDTSNYTTSVALYDCVKRNILHRRLLDVEQGSIGLRQRDAVFTLRLTEVTSCIKNVISPSEGLCRIRKAPRVDAPICPAF